MAWIEAILAFAITMMALSTMASMIVETLHRVVGVREKRLCQVIDQLFNKMIWPKLASAAGVDSGREAAGSKTQTAQKFIDVMTSARFKPISAKQPGYKKIVSCLLRGKQIKALTTFEFIERLAETDAGRRLMVEGRRRGQAYLDTMITDIASKYEDFGESAREYFTRRARMISVGVAIVLAFCINFDAVNVFKTYLASQSVRSAIVEKGEKFAKQLKAQEEKLEAIQAKPMSQNQEKVFEEIKESQQQIHQLYGDLVADGVPIGWAHAPFNIDKEKWKKKDVWAKALNIAGWLLSLLLGGLLIGLGGPFWYDLFKRLSGFTNIVRGLQSAVQKPKEQAMQKTAEGQVAPSSDPVAVFKVAAAAKQTEIPQGRTLLLPDGTAYMKG